MYIMHRPLHSNNVSRSNVFHNTVTGLSHTPRTCPVNKHMYKQHIQTKIESIEHVLRFTVSECNTNQHKLLNTKTCDMLWNDVERLLQNKFELETDLVLINETIPTNHFVLNQFIRKHWI